VKKVKRGSIKGLVMKPKLGKKKSRTGSLAGKTKKEIK